MEVSTTKGMDLLCLLVLVISVSVIRVDSQFDSNGKVELIITKLQSLLYMNFCSDCFFWCLQLEKDEEN